MLNASRSQKSERLNHMLNHNFIQHKKKHHAMTSIHEFSVSDESEDMNENLCLEADEDNHDCYTKRNIRKENTSDIKAIKLVWDNLSQVNAWNHLSSDSYQIIMIICIFILRVVMFSEFYIILDSRKNDVVRVNSSWFETWKIMLSDLIREIWQTQCRVLKEIEWIKRKSVSHSKDFERRKILLYQIKLYFWSCTNVIWEADVWLYWRYTSSDNFQD